MVNPEKEHDAFKPDFHVTSKLRNFSDKIPRNERPNTTNQPGVSARISPLRFWTRICALFFAGYFVRDFSILAKAGFLTIPVERPQIQLKRVMLNAKIQQKLLQNMPSEYDNAKGYTRSIDGDDCHHYEHNRRCYFGSSPGYFAWSFDKDHPPPM